MHNVDNYGDIFLVFYRVLLVCGLFKLKEPILITNLWISVDKFGFNI